MTLIIAANRTDHIVVVTDRSVAKSDHARTIHVDKQGSIISNEENYTQPVAVSDQKAIKTLVWRYGFLSGCGSAELLGYIYQKLQKANIRHQNQAHDIIIQACHELESIVVYDEYRSRYIKYFTAEHLSQTTLVYSYFNKSEACLRELHLHEPESVSEIKPSGTMIHPPYGLSSDDRYYWEDFIPQIKSLNEKLLQGFHSDDIRVLMQYYTHLFAPFYKQQSTMTPFVSADFDVCVQTRETTYRLHSWLDDGIDYSIQQPVEISQLAVQTVSATPRAQNINLC